MITGFTTQRGVSDRFLEVWSLNRGVLPETFADCRLTEQALIRGRRRGGWFCGLLLQLLASLVHLLQVLDHLSERSTQGIVRIRCRRWRRR